MLIAVNSSYKLVVFPLPLPPGFLLFFFFSIIEMFSSYLHPVGGEFDKREKKVKAAEQDREKQEQEWEEGRASPLVPDSGAGGDVGGGAWPMADSMTIIRLSSMLGCNEYC